MRCSCDKCTDHCMTDVRKYCTSVLSGNVKESGKVILDPYLESDQHQNLITSTGHPLPKFGLHPIHHHL